MQSSNSIKRLKQWAARLKAEIIALYLVLKHPQTPLHVKLFVALVVGYALSPIDLIPDFIPIIGYLDDLILLPIGIAIAIRLVPPDLLDACRKEAIDHPLAVRPKSRWAALVIIMIWLVLILSVLSVVVPQSPESPETQASVFDLGDYQFTSKDLADLYYEVMMESFKVENGGNRFFAIEIEDAGYLSKGDMEYLMSKLLKKASEVVFYEDVESDRTYFELDLNGEFLQTIGGTILSVRVSDITEDTVTLSSFSGYGGLGGNGFTFKAVFNGTEWELTILQWKMALINHMTLKTFMLRHGGFFMKK